MPGKKMILLPLDGSDVALSALLPAKSVAVLLGMFLSILHISDEDLSQDELLQKIKINKKELPRFLVNHKKGDPAEIILEESKKAGFIIMCTHGKSYDTGKISGSVTYKIIENSEVPVMLIRPEIILAKENNFWKPKKVLIPLNGTAGAAQALTSTFEIIAKTKASVDLLHIPVAASKLPEQGSFTTSYYEDYSHHEWSSWSKEFQARFCSIIHECSKLNIHTSIGDPGEEIINFSKKHNNDLISMAWHGKLLPPHARILRKVLSEAPCPVLLTKINIDS